MSIFATYATDGTTGRIRAALPLNTLNTSQLLEGQHTLPTGASFEFTEEVVIRTTLTQPKLVNTLLDYYAPCYKIGNWELGDELYDSSGASYIEYGKCDGEHGFIRSFNQRIRKRSIATVRGNRLNTEFVLHRGTVDQCNLALKDAVPLPAPLNGLVYVPAFDSSIVTYQTSYKEQALTETILETRLANLYIFLFPGCELTEVRYFAYANNFINTDEPIAATYRCLLGDTCDDEFDAFVRDRNGGNPIDSFSPPMVRPFIYSTYDLCDSSEANACTRGSFTCASGETRDFYFAVST